MGKKKLTDMEIEDVVNDLEHAALLEQRRCLREIERKNGHGSADAVRENLLKRICKSTAIVKSGRRISTVIMGLR